MCLLHAGIGEYPVAFCVTDIYYQSGQSVEYIRSVGQAYVIGIPCHIISSGIAACGFLAGNVTYYCVSRCKIPGDLWREGVFKVI